MSCLRHLETTPFCPADIFPREGARSYRRMGHYRDYFFCASLPLAPSRGKGWGKGSLFCFFRRRQQVNNEVKVNSFCLALLVVNSLQYYLQSLHLRSTGGLSLKWESHRNHEGITWDLRPSWSTCTGEILGDGSLPMQGDLEGQFLIQDTTCFAPRT